MAHRIDDFFVVALIFHSDGIEVKRFLQIAHSDKRHVHLAIHVFIAILDHVLQHANDLI